MKLNIFPEICCDYCMDVVHNHFDCPACGVAQAPTGTYQDIHGMTEFEDVIEISCECCNTSFQATSTEGWLDEWEWKQVE